MNNNTIEEVKMNIFSDMRFRKELSKFLAREDFEDYDDTNIQTTFEILYKVQDAINDKDRFIVLEDMNMWHVYKDLIDELFSVYGNDYMWSEMLSNNENYKDVYVRKDIGDEVTTDFMLLVASEVSILAENMYAVQETIGSFYSYQIVELVNKNINEFYVYNIEKVIEDEGNEFDENVASFFKEILLNNYSQKQLTI